MAKNRVPVEQGDLSKSTIAQPSAKARDAVLPKGVDPSKAASLARFEVRDQLSAFLGTDTMALVGSLPGPLAGRISVRFKKTMQRDPVLRFGLKVLKAPLLNVEWWVDGPDKRVAAFCEEVIRKQYNSLYERALEALDFGWQPFEWVWGTRTVSVKNSRLKQTATFRDAQIPIYFHDLDPETISPHVDKASGEFVGIKVGGAQDIIPRWKFFVVANEVKWQDPRGHSLLDDVYRTYYWSELGSIMAARYFERRAIPNPWARVPSDEFLDPSTGSLKKGYEIGQAAIDALRAGQGAVIPSDRDQTHGQFDWDLGVLQDDKRGDMFIDYIEFLDRRKLMGLLIPPKVVLQGAKVGSFAETKEITSTWTEILEGVLENLWISAINEQLIPMLVDMNFGPDTERPEFKTSGFKKADLALLSRVIEPIFAAKRKVLGSTGEEKGEASLAELVDGDKLLQELSIPGLDKDNFEQVEQPDEAAARMKAEALGEKAKALGTKKKKSGPSGEKRRDILTEN